MATAARLIKCGIFEEYHGWTLENMKDVDKESVKFIQKYAADLEGFYDKGVGLFLYGKNGLGKTTAACALLKRAMVQGYDVQMVSLAAAKTAYIDSWYDSAKKDRFSQRITNVHFLAIDEVGKDDSPIAISMLENLVRYRAQRNFPSIVISNNDLGQLKAKTGNASLESLLKRHFMPVFFGGEDLASKKSAAIRAMFK